jgi:hypothetical protein
MTPTVPELLARKQRLLQQLQEERRLNEQDEIERLLAGINALLNRLDVPPIEKTQHQTRAWTPAGSASTSCSTSSSTLQFLKSKQPRSSLKAGLFR